MHVLCGDCLTELLLERWGPRWTQMVLVPNIDLDIFQAARSRGIRHLEVLLGELLLQVGGVSCRDI